MSDINVWDMDAPVTNRQFMAILGVSLILGILAGGVIATATTHRAVMEEAIEHGCAGHNPKTGIIEWIKP